MMQVYNAYLDNYLKGDVEAIHPLLDINYTQVGSAESEVFYNKKDAVQFLYDTIDQVSGKLEMRNRMSKMEQHDHIILIQEVCDLYALADKEWIFYSKFRVSTLMQEKKDGWKLIHQHSSFPDARTEEGQNVAIDKIAEENIQLREAVKRRTIELEQKNKDLFVEVALEKVRSRTMAMHKSDELAQTTEVLHQQLIELDIKADRTSIAFPDERGAAEFWSTNQGGTKIDHKFKADLAEPYLGVKSVAGWKKKLKSIVIQLEGEELSTLLNYYKEEVGLPFSAQIPTTTKRYYTLAYFSHGWITLSTTEPLSNEKLNTLERFAAVFNLTYTRFLDLQKAEAQAREATIEASLERVRARAMAMHDSKDVGNAIGVLFSELDKLGIVTLRCGILIIEEANKTMEVLTATSTEEGKVGQLSGKFDMTIHPLLEGLFNAWKQQQAFYTYVLSGQDLLDYFKAISKDAPEYVLPVQNISIEKQSSSAFFFNEGALFIFTSDPLSAETSSILQRFTAVFGLTYRRYLDLMVAEQQTRQAVKQASLDRVRAEIASMRSSEHLQQITPLVWRELITLNVSFERCGVFIINEVSATVQAYLSTPDGRSLGLLDLSINDNDLILKAVEHWRMGQVYMGHWDKEQFADWIKSMIDKGQIPNRESYIGDENPPSSLYLHFVPFTQGMLYVGNTSQLTEDEIGLVKSLAEAFEIAYARYEDFKKLEDAKNKVELTLSDLRSAQKQLIQSEKMASLGELTAGIAHEIQNPLNFVNNFSEVSLELLEEVKSEKLKAKSERSEELETELLDDISQNLQKISHHGKRADFIVKGMLQHSRTSTGEKQATNINILADEFLKLSYHGLRAKDKSFNAELATNFDKNLPKINVVQQDIGRVLLNLFNNAFYAVQEKRKAASPKQKEEYKPAVEVSTSAKDGFVIITVKDNGNGIPEGIKDKIMQPFFTTKPTGEGTGLGLSLSYDIIKAHGGDIKVETKDGEFAEFIIQLPMN